MQSGVGFATNFFIVVVFLLLEIGLLDLGLGLVQPVDDCVFALWHEDAFDETWVFKRNLANVHGAVFFQVGPGRVYDGDVVFFVTLRGGDLMSVVMGLGGRGEGRTNPRWNWLL